MKLRWKPEDIAEVKAAAHTAGEDASEFIRTAALHRARGEETLSTPDEKQAESKEQSARGDK
jgi:uncharacterized protein (DUF1778 family)